MAKIGGDPSPVVNTRSNGLSQPARSFNPMAEHLAYRYLMAVAAVADEATDMYELASAARVAQSLRDSLLLLERAQSDDEGVGVSRVEARIGEDRGLGIGEAASVKWQPSEVA